MNQERARVDVLHPTLCDETAKDGAPERWRDVVSEMRLVCGVQSCLARYPHLKIEIWGTRFRGWVDGLYPTLCDETAKDGVLKRCRGVKRMITARGRVAR